MSSEEALSQDNVPGNPSASTAATPISSPVSETSRTSDPTPVREPNEAAQGADSASTNSASGGNVEAIVDRAGSTATDGTPAPASGSADPQASPLPTEVPASDHLAEQVAGSSVTDAAAQHLVEGETSQASSTTDSDSEGSEESKRKLRLNPTLGAAAPKAVPSLGHSSSSAASPPPTPAVDHGAKSISQPETEGSAAAAVATTDQSGSDNGSSEATDSESAISMAVPSTEIPPPPENLDAQMEAEINAALASGDAGKLAAAIPAELGTDAKPGQQPTEENLEAGAKLTGKVQSVHGDNVFLELGFRSPGVIPLRQFAPDKQPSIGQALEIQVEKYDAAEGLILCNLPRGRRKVSGGWENLAVGQVVDCMVTKTNKGGLEVTLGSLRGFLPSGQVDLNFVADLETFVGQKLQVQILEVNPKKRNLIVSRRVLLQAERADAEENAWKTLTQGQECQGRVKTIKDYGAFVDIGGVDGFLHIGEMSWQRLKHPSELLKEGDSVNVKILSLDPEKKKISLGMKQLVQNPWSAAAEKYPAGATVTGKVSRVADFGAFVELETGVEGLIHISELDHRRVRKVGDVLKEGQEVSAKVLEVDLERKRISMSLKALLDKPAPPAEPETPAAPPYQRTRKEPLRGGTTGGSNRGGLFGNPNDFK